MYGYRLPNPLWEGERLSCCKCGIQDAPLYTGDVDADGKPIWSHTVTLDLVFIRRNTITPKEKADGYEYMKLADQQAKVRPLCRPCLQHIEDTRMAWKDFEAMKREDDEASRPNNYYNILCGE